MSVRVQKMDDCKYNPSIVMIGSMKTVKTFFLAFPALNSTAMNKKQKHSNSYPIINEFQTGTRSNPQLEIRVQVHFWVKSINFEQFSFFVISCAK